MDNNNSQYEYVIARALSSEDGRVALATMLIQPIRKALDYMGIARKVLQVDYIPDGVLPIYEKDVNVTAIKVPGKGELPTPQVEGDQFAVETFIIGVNPEILRTTVRKRRFNVINRIQARSRATIQEVEDQTLFDLLNVATSSPVNAYTAATYTGALTLSPLADAHSQMQDQDVFPTKLLVRPSLGRDFKLFTNTVFDPIHQHQVLKTGLFGKLWGMDLYYTKKAPAATMYLTAEPEFLGVIPVRQDIDVLDSPNNRELKLGWSIYEEVGFAIGNNFGVARINKT